MREAKTYLSFLAVCGVLVGILAFLYSPNNPKTNTVSVMENIESRSLEDDAAQAAQDEPEIIETTQPDESEPQEAQEDIVQPEELSQEEQEARQRRRIHFTQILLRKQQELDQLQDKKNRSTDNNEAFDTQIEQVETLIRTLTQQIQDLSD